VTEIFRQESQAATAQLESSGRTTQHKRWNHSSFIPHL